MEECPPILHSPNSAWRSDFLKWKQAEFKAVFSAFKYIFDGIYTQSSASTTVFSAFSIRYFTISFCDSMSNAIFLCRPPLRCDGIMYAYAHSILSLCILLD